MAKKTKSKHSKKSVKLKKDIVLKDWREYVIASNVFDNYSCDVIVMVESATDAWSSMEAFLNEAKESDEVNPITQSNIMEPEVETTSDSVLSKVFQLANDDVKQELAKNDELSIKTLALLIKLFILFKRDEFIQHRENQLRLKQLRMKELIAIKKSKSQVSKGKKKGKKAKSKKSKSKKSESKKSESKKSKSKKSKSGKSGSKKSKSNKSDAPKTLEDLYKKLHENIDPNIKPYSPPELECEAEMSKHSYFTICKIYDPNLLSELNTIGVEVTALLEVGSTIQGSFIENPDVDSVRLVEMDKFWNKWNTNSFHMANVLPPNTCYIKYLASNSLKSQQIFEQIEQILYNISDMKRLYQTYLEHSRFVNVKEYNKPVPLKCMKTYNQRMDQIPNECITCAFLLDCLLDEVCVRVNGPQPSAFNDSKSKRNVKHHANTVPKKMEAMMKHYECNSLRKKLHKKSLINIPTRKLDYGNVTEYMCGHLGEERVNYMINLILNSLKRVTAPLNLFETVMKADKTELIMYNYQFQQWSEVLTTVNAYELPLCVYSYLFANKKFQSPLTETKSTIRNVESLLLGDMKPYNKNKQQFHLYLIPPKYALKKMSSSMSLSADKLQNSIVTPNIEDINKYCKRVEILNESAMIQIMSTAYNDFEHFDYTYFSPNDTFLIRFYHNDKTHDVNNILNYSLRTFICFRDFCSYISTDNIGWLVDQETLYWQLLKQKEKLKQIEALERAKKLLPCEEDFIIEGSLKDQIRKEAERAKFEKKGKKTKSKKGKSKSKTKSTASTKKSKKSKSTKKSKKSKVSKEKKSKKKKEDTTVKESKIERINLTVPKDLPIIDPNKIYDFEGYNLGLNYFFLENETSKYNTDNGLSVIVNRQRWSRSLKSRYSFNITANDSSLIFHCHNTFDGVLLCEKPLTFHVSVANGIMMGFALNIRMKTEISNDMKNGKHVVTDELNKKDIDIVPKVELKQKGNTLPGPQTKTPNKTNKRKILEHLKTAINRKIPIFKIISSRLHKYQYVKRIKSHIEIPIGKLIKRLTFKRKMFVRLSRSKQILESKCIPYSSLLNQERSKMLWKWKATLPTGVSLETVQPVAPYPLYVRQKYIIDRPDVPVSREETHRCFLRDGTVMKFFRDGSIATMVPNKTYIHYKYGCFSSNKKTVKKKIIPRTYCNLKQNGLYNDLQPTKIEKRIRRICRKYQKHMIDIDDNYRFESTRDKCRRLHYIYKLSKKLYMGNKQVIPLLNYSVITSTGRKYSVKNNIVYDEPNKYRTCIHSNYLLNEIVLHRQDGTSWLLNKIGEAITQFPDGTRIITWCVVLDENLILEETVASRESFEEETPSMTNTKYCQTNHESNSSEYNSTEEEEEEIKSIEYDEDAFVLLGINYRFEHPHYVKVIYDCVDENIIVSMPDNIDVTIHKDGTYEAHLLNDDFIDVKHSFVQYNASSCVECNMRTKCTINTLPFYFNNNNNQIKKENFLTVHDNTGQLFQIDFKGQMKKYSNKAPDVTQCNEKHNVSKERLFALKRDLSGEEFFNHSISNRFVHTMHYFDEFSKNQTLCTGSKICDLNISKPLRRNYTEHMMMAYNEPVLAVTNMDELILSNISQFDVNMMISKRRPLYYFKRSLYNLTMSEVIYVLKNQLYNLTKDERKLNVITVNQIMTNVTHTPEEQQVDKVRKKKIRKLRTLDKNKAKVDKFKRIIKSPTPKYFETLFGFMFTIVSECVERAMILSDEKLEPEQEQSIISSSKIQFEEDIFEEKELFERLSSEEFIPIDKITDSKSDTSIHDMIDTYIERKTISKSNVTVEELYPFIETPEMLSMEEEQEEEEEEQIHIYASQSQMKVSTTSDYDKIKEILDYSFNESKCRKRCSSKSATLDKCNSIALTPLRHTCPPPSKVPSKQLGALKSGLTMCCEINTLAWNILKAIESKPVSYEDQLENAIRNTGLDFNFDEEYINYLLEEIKWLRIYTKMSDEEMIHVKALALDILRQIRSEVNGARQKNQEQNKYNRMELLYIANSIRLIMFHILGGNSRSEIILNVKSLLLGGCLTRSNVDLVLDYAEQNLFVIHYTDHKSVENLFNEKQQDVIRHILATLKALNKKCPPCSTCNRLTVPSPTNKKMAEMYRKRALKKALRRKKEVEFQILFTPPVQRSLSDRSDMQEVHYNASPRGSKDYKNNYEYLQSESTKQQLRKIKLEERPVAPAVQQSVARPKSADPHAMHQRELIRHAQLDKNTAKPKVCDFQRF